MRPRLIALVTLLVAAVAALGYDRFLQSKPRAETVVDTPFLEPCQSVMVESVISVEYALRVRRILDPSHDLASTEPGRAAENLLHPRAKPEIVAQVISPPGWQDPEWAITVFLPQYGDAAMELVEAEESVWGSNFGDTDGLLLKRQPVSVKARGWSVTLPRSVAEAMGVAWRHWLLAVQPRRGQAPLVFDAGSYTFHRDARAEVSLCGSIVAPEPASGPGELVKIADALRSYARGERTRDDAINEVTRTLQHLQQLSGLGR